MYINPFIAETDFKRQSLDVYRRQIMTSKIDPHTERVKYFYYRTHKIGCRYSNEAEDDF